MCACVCVQVCVHVYGCVWMLPAFVTWGLVIIKPGNVRPPLKCVCECVCDCIVCVCMCVCVCKWVCKCVVLCVCVCVR